MSYGTIFDTGTEASVSRVRMSTTRLLGPGTASLRITGVYLVACLLCVSQSLAQAPGRAKGRPSQSQDDKIKVQKETFKDVIDWSDVNLGPGEVDQRLERFWAKIGVKGPGLVKDKGYLLEVGEATVAGPIKPGWVEQRIIAFNEAELKARAEMAKAIERAIQSDQGLSNLRVTGSLSYEVADQLGKMKAAAQSGVVDAERYEEATRVFATAQVTGAITIKTISGDNKGEYKVVHVLLWNPRLRELALNAVADADYFLPLEKVTQGEIAEIPQAESDLVNEMGAHVYFNQKGQRYYVAFAQSEPIAESKDEIGRALTFAPVSAAAAVGGRAAVRPLQPAGGQSRSHPNDGRRSGEPRSS